MLDQRCMSAIHPAVIRLLARIQDHLIRGHRHAPKIELASNKIFRDDEFRVDIFRGDVEL